MLISAEKLLMSTELNIWIKKQPHISVLAIQRDFGSKVSGLQFHRCFILYGCFWGFWSHFSTCFCRTSHNLIGNKFAILKYKKLRNRKILKSGKTFYLELTLVNCITNIKNLWLVWELWGGWRVFIWHCLIVFFCPIKVTEHVTSRVSGGEFSIK